MIEIVLENISKSYGSGQSAVRAVDDVSVSIAGGEFFFLLGPSGCGKSTLLRMVAGLIEPSAGRILLGGEDVTNVPPERRGTAMVFQNYALWPHMTVAKNVEFGPKMQGLPGPRQRELAAQSLARVQMQDLGARKPNQLSGGQQQRVALARALAAGVGCLLLDEPLSNLDARLRLHMRGQLRDIVKSAGVTAIYVTHDQKEAISMADRIAVMNAGKIVQIGTAREIYDSPASRFVADFIGEANFLEGELIAIEPAGCQVKTPIGIVYTRGPAAQSGTPVRAVSSSINHGREQSEETHGQDAHATRGLDRPNGPRVGDKVTCCVRPERVRIAGDGGSTAPYGQAANCAAVAPDTSVSATVVSSTYLGEAIQYKCAVGKDIAWSVHVAGQAGGPLAAGAKITLQVHREDTVLLTE